MAKKKVGRPNLYKSRIEPYLDLITDLKAQGKDDEYIFKLLNVSSRTYYTHKSIIDEFSQSYKKGQDRLLDSLEATLYELALGKATKKTVKTKTGAYGELISTDEVIEYLPPDKIALFFAMTNISDKWKHKQEVSTNNNIDTINAIKELSETIDEAE